MSKIILILLLCFTNFAHATNQATAHVGATIVNLNSTETVQKIDIPGGNIELVSQYENKDCYTSYQIKLSKNNTISQSEKFGTCSDIVRTKLVGDKLIISMPKKNDKNFTTYIYDTDKLILLNQ